MTTTHDDRLLHIRYSSPHHLITVEDGYWHRSDAAQETFESPVRDRAVHSEATALKGTLSPTQLADLVKFIESSGFNRLMDAYGAPEDVPSYPHSLFIGLGEFRKTVIYRNSPDYAEAPDAFRAIERYLLNLCPEGDPVATLSVHYHSANDDILLEDQHIHHTVTHYTYDNPVSGIPSNWATSVLVDASLTPHEWESLSQFIHDSQFNHLEDRYGAPEGERAYPYTLTVRQGNRTKRVAYYSNPDYGDAPATFRSVEEYLLNLSQEVMERRPLNTPQPALR